MTAHERPVAAVGMIQAHQQSELLAARVLEQRGAGLFAYAYRLSLSETTALTALRHAAVTLRSGTPRALDEENAFEIARAEIGRVSVGAPEAAPSAAVVHDDSALLRTGFHRRLHALPVLERQCWLLRHTGGHAIDAVADLLGITAAEVRSALASAATALIAGEPAEAEAQGDSSARHA